MAFVSCAAIDFAGLLAGLASAIAAIPIVGIAWVYMVGGNRIFERILENLSTRLS